MINPYGDILEEIRYSLELQLERGDRNLVYAQISEVQNELARLRKIEAAAKVVVAELYYPSLGHSLGMKDLYDALEAK